MDQKNKQEQLQEIFSFYKKQSGDQENYRAMLEELQEVYGFLSEEILKQAAEALHIKVTVLSCLVKYSSTLKLAPYQHKIVACTGERCGNKNGLYLLNKLKQELKIDKNGLSEDKKILLSTQNCLKHCKTSPNIMIDGELYTHMTEERIMELLNNLRS
nr:NAD(P)H-dependent oxidoreductase subunit E [uncultured Blautia sp.]